MKTVFSLACALCVAMVSMADAQVIRRSCYQTYQPTYAPTYQAQTYHAPYYQPQYYVQPYALPTYITNDYYFSVDSYYRDKLLVDAITGRLTLLGLTGQPAGPPMQGAPRRPAPQPDPIEQPVLISTPVPDGLKNIVDAKCVKCHGATTPGGRANLSELATVSEGVRWQAHGLVNAGEMPKGLGPLEDAEVLKFYEWAKSARKAKLAQSK